MTYRYIIKTLTIISALSVLAISIWYLSARFEWRDAFAHLLRTDFVRLIGLVFASHFAFILARTWRWRMLVHQSNPDIRFIDLYWITSIVVSLSIFTPGQLGEAFKIEMLKRQGLLGRLPGFAVFAVERILDVLVIAIMGIIGLLFDTVLAERYPLLKLLATVLIVVCLILLFVLMRYNASSKISFWLGRISIGSSTPILGFRILTVTLLTWTFVATGWQISLSAVDIYLSIPEILWLISLVTLGTVLSFVPGGLGVAELLTTEALLNMGVAPITAQAGALILRSFGLIVVVFGLAHLLIRLILGFKKT